MHLDVPTLGVIGFLMGVVLSLGFMMLGTVLEGERALKLWAGAFWLGTLAALLGGLRGMIPDWLTALGGNGTYVVSNALVLMGVAAHLRYRLDWRLPGACAVLFLAGFTWLTFVTVDVTARMELFSLQLVVWDAWTVHVLLTRSPSATRRSARFAAMMFGLDLVFNVVRLLALVVLGGGSHPGYGQAMVSTYVFGIVIALAETLAMVLMLAERLVAELRHRARIDGLTGLLNRDAIFASGRKVLAECARRQQPCALLMFDLDHFKRINDRVGHAAGDAVLRHFAGLLREDGVPTVDALARYGGEEFLLLLPGESVAGAQALAERLRARVARTPARHGDEAIPLTTSIGVAGRGTCTRFEHLVAVADEALYRAKAGGRNRVAVIERASASTEPAGACSDGSAPAYGAASP